MKILIMGLPGSGKTTLAIKLSKRLKAKLLNADKIRKKFNDWDFSKKGRIRQAKRLAKISQKFEKKGFLVVADFICPNPETRKLFNSDFIIWMDTIKTSKFKDTNIMFVKPKKFNVKIKRMSLDFRKKESLKIEKKINRTFKLG
mgnify:FL=1